ncbi:hypothetical protein Tco_0634117 [Tanacetum coccineum]
MLAIPHLSQVSSMAEIDSKEAQMKLKAGIRFRITSHNKHTWSLLSQKKHKLQVLEMKTSAINRAFIRRIQVLDTAYWGFLGVGITLDIFQNITLIPYFEYGVLSLSGYGVLSLFLYGLCFEKKQNSQAAGQVVKCMIEEAMIEGNHGVQVTINQKIQVTLMSAATSVRPSRIVHQEPTISITKWTSNPMAWQPHFMAEQGMEAF